MATEAQPATAGQADPRRRRRGQIQSTNHRLIMVNSCASAGGGSMPYATWVAVTDGGAESAVAKAGGASQPVLYVEFRKDGVPVDPGPWWAANEGQKVRG